MDKITLKEIQQIEFKMLEVLQKLCAEHQLRFFLAGGTLLGSIRHNGFIPWDDDIDLLMPREDYEKLKKLARSEEIRKYSEECRIRVPGDKNYAFPFIKITSSNTIVYESLYPAKYATGVWIDIFPLDRYYNSDKKIRSYLRRLTVMNYLRYSVSASLMRYVKQIHQGTCWKSKLYSLLKLLCVTPLRIAMTPIGCERICTHMDSMAKKMDSYEQNPLYVGNGTWPSKFKDHFSKQCFNESVAHPFETATMPIPQGYHEYLTRMYGDYMKPPDPLKRGNHVFVGYWVK